MILWSLFGLVDDHEGMGLPNFLYCIGEQKSCVVVEVYMAFEHKDRTYVCAWKMLALLLQPFFFVVMNDV